MRLIAKRDIPRLAGRAFKIGERVPASLLPGRTLSNYLARGWIGMAEEDADTPELVGANDTTTPPPETTSNTPVDVPPSGDTKRSRGRPSGSKDKQPRRKRSTKTTAKRGNNLR